MQLSNDPRLYRFLRRVGAGAGWILYFYEWVHVSWETPSHEPITFSLIFILSILLMHAGIAAWVAHNKRLAATGKRGRMTRYTVPVFTHDYLGRQLVVDEATPMSQEVIVRVDGDTKFYLPALMPEGPKPKPKRKAKRRSAKRLLPVPELV